MSSLPDKLQADINKTLGRLFQWFQTVHGPGGFGGPISHWWESSMLYCGPMADWRYEGILCGYVSLYRSTHDARWLDRAIIAAEDVLSAQLISGKFRNSAFQQGPMEGGTPHEAGVDVGLLELATLFREIGDEHWQKYFRAAELNILRYQIGELWNGEGFKDQPWDPIMVPNKNATLIEALILYEVLSGQDMTLYLEKAVEVILSAQEKSGPRAGGIIHRGTGPHRLAIGIYNARSICGLLRAYERDPRDEILDGVYGSIGFLHGLITQDGSYFGRYPDGSLIANPRMIAGSGDLLRAMAWGLKYFCGSEEDVLTLINVLTKAQLPTGGIPTGIGFAWRGSHYEYQSLPEFRDILPVAGWCDKAFRALALFTSQITDGEIGPVESECLWKGKKYIFRETTNEISLSELDNKKLIFQWKKFSNYPTVYLL